MNKEDMISLLNRGLNRQLTLAIIDKLYSQSKPEPKSKPRGDKK